MAGIFVLEVLMQLSCYRALATHASNKFHSENFSVPDFLGGVTSSKFHIPLLCNEINLSQAFKGKQHG